MKVDCFVDSCIWKNVNDLLKILDDNYSKNIKSNTYNYDKRNKTTSHSYMILNAALQKQIDKCECIIFIKTDNSISGEDGKGQYITNSPWIYSEILTTNIIKPKKPKYYEMLNENKESDGLYHSKELKIEYYLNINKYKRITLEDINRASRINFVNSDSLIILYQLMDMK